MQQGGVFSPQIFRRKGEGVKRDKNDLRGNTMSIIIDQSQYYWQNIDIVIGIESGQKVTLAVGKLNTN